MCKLKLLFLILTAANGLQVVLSYANGNIVVSCGSMIPVHGSAVPQPTKMPYTIHPAFINVSAGQVITVTLTANSDPFRGFLLQAEDIHHQRPVGQFTWTDSGTQLLDCGVKHGAAVSHTTNSDKRSISVNWTSEQAGSYTFRATFVRRESTFWVPTLPRPTTTTTSATSISMPPPTASTTNIGGPSSKPPPTASTTKTSTPSSKPPPTASTTKTSTPSSKPPPTASAIGKRSVTAMMISGTLLEYCCFIKLIGNSCGGLLVQVHVSLMSLSEVASIIALAFAFIDGCRTEAYFVLICTATALQLVQIIVTILYCGLSHKHRWKSTINWFQTLNSLVIVCLTAAPIFIGLASIEACSSDCTLHKVMGGLVGWNILFVLLHFLLSWWKRKGLGDWSNKTENILQISLLVAFTLGNAMFLMVILDSIFMS